MNLPFILEIVIGLICIYLILSLLSSGIQELLATLLQWRAAHLKQAIEILISGKKENLSDEDTLKKTRLLLQSIYNNPLMAGISQESRYGIEAWLREVTRRGLIFRRKNLTLTGDEPSYIPSETFATVLLEKINFPQIAQDLTVLKLKDLVEGDLLPHVQILLEAYLHTPEFNPLKACFGELETSLRESLNAFQSGKISLQTCVYQIRGALNSFIEQSSPASQPKTPSGDTPPGELDSHVIQQLLQLQRRLFYEDEVTGYSTVHELIRWLQPSLSEVAQEITKDLPPALQESLIALAKRAAINASPPSNQLEHLHSELKQLKVEIQTWFDRCMDRASGVYKRNTKGICFLIGLGLAIAINADTIHITSQLASDATLREVLVSNADLISQNCPPSSNGDSSALADCIAETVQQEVPLPLGWSQANTALQDQAAASSQLPLAPPIRRLLGWMITGFAISMGAPFWFELMGRVVNVRNTGRKPETEVDK